MRCAEEYAAENGTSEARRAFNEDRRWKHGPLRVAVYGIESGEQGATAYVFPPDPSREGGAW